MAEQGTIFVIDASSFIYRAFFAAEREDRQFNLRADGHPIGAVKKFTERMFYFYTQGIRGFMPSHIAVIFDAHRKSWRHDVMPAYKAKRKATPPDLALQMPLMRDVCRAFDLRPIELPGYEADDLIATYVSAARQTGIRAMVISADKDLLQLIRPGVTFFDPAQSNREERIFSTDEDVIEKFLVPPKMVPDLQALCGDQTDGIPGAPGVGPKTAAKWLRRFGSLENVLANVQHLDPPSRRTTMMDPAVQEQVRKCRELVELDANVPLPVRMHDLQLNTWPGERLVAFMREQGFNALARKACEHFGVEA